MDNAQLKQIGVWIILVLGALGTPFIEWIHNLSLTPGWIAFLSTAWYVVDYIIAVLIYVYLHVKKVNSKWKIRTLEIGIGIGLIVIIAAFGALLIEWIVLLGFTVIWTTALGIAYYGTEILITRLIVHYFKIPIEDVPIESSGENLTTDTSYNDSDSTASAPILAEVDPETLDPIESKEQ